MSGRLLETDKCSVLQLRYPTEPRREDRYFAKPQQGAFFPPDGLQSRFVGFGAVLPLPGSSATARDTAPDPSAANGTVSGATPARRSAFFPAMSVH